MHAGQQFRSGFLGFSLDHAVMHVAMLGQRAIAVQAVGADNAPRLDRVVREGENRVGAKVRDNSHPLSLNLLPFLRAVW